MIFTPPTKFKVAKKLYKSKVKKETYRKDNEVLDKLFPKSGRYKVKGETKSNKINHEEPRNELIPWKVTPEKDFGSESEDSTYYNTTK